jgi:hypothetical protein
MNSEDSKKMKERKKDIKKKGRKPGNKLGIKKHTKILKFKIKQRSRKSKPLKLITK